MKNKLLIALAVLALFCGCKKNESAEPEIPKSTVEFKVYYNINDVDTLRVQYNFGNKLYEAEVESQTDSSYVWDKYFYEIPKSATVNYLLGDTNLINPFIGLEIFIDDSLIFQQTNKKFQGQFNIPE